MYAAHSFCSQTNCADGGDPFAPLFQASDGNFYGTTFNGGAEGYGTVYDITASGTLTTLHSFRYTDGAGPVAGLIQAKNGNFYGTTLYGGANGAGTVFEITAAGKLGRCTVSDLLATAPSPTQGWCKLPMETFMAQPMAAERTGTARSLQSSPAAS